MHRTHMHRQNAYGKRNERIYCLDITDIHLKHAHWNNIASEAEPVLNEAYIFEASYASLSLSLSLYRVSECSKCLTVTNSEQCCAWSICIFIYHMQKCGIEREVHAISTRCQSHDSLALPHIDTISCRFSSLEYFSPSIMLPHPSLYIYTSERTNKTYCVLCRWIYTVWGLITRFPFRVCGQIVRCSCLK
jgi:hypothetical protein